MELQRSAAVYQERALVRLFTVQQQRETSCTSGASEMGYTCIVPLGPGKYALQHQTLSRVDRLPFAWNL